MAIFQGNLINFQKNYITEHLWANKLKMNISKLNFSEVKNQALLQLFKR